MHVDMNAFFASVEQRDNPRLRGQPVAVTGGGARTIITTSSYEARAFGVRTGMTVVEALGRCPALKVIVGRNRRYCEISAGIMNTFDEISPVVEIFSVDEAFIEITGCQRIYDTPAAAAMLVRRLISERFGLGCSIGIGPNKLVAKLASDMQKPDGLVEIPPAAARGVMGNMPVGDLCGVGKKTAHKLTALGIMTCSQLADCPHSVLRSRFGIIGLRLPLMAAGHDDSPLVARGSEPDAKSFGHSFTLAADITERNEIERQILLLATMVSFRTRAAGQLGRVVELVLRHDDFSTFGRRVTLPAVVSLPDEIAEAAKGLIDKTWLLRPVRMIGVRLAALASAPQPDLFEDRFDRERLEAAIDELNARFGAGCIARASLLGEKTGGRVISPSWRPDGGRNVEMD